MPNFFMRHWLPAISAGLIFAPLAWWSFDTSPPVKILSIDVPEPDVKRGGNLTLIYSVVRNRACPGVVQRIISDSKDAVHLIEPYRFNSGFGRQGRRLTLGAETYPVSAPVPFGAAPGPAEFQTVIEYYCNPLQQALNRGITVVMPVVRFNIMAQIAENSAPLLRAPGAEPKGEPAESLRTAPNQIIRKIVP